MITNAETQEAELDNPYVLIVDKKLSSYQEIVGVLQAVTQTRRPLFVIAEDYADEVLATLVMNKLRGTFLAAAIKAPSYGEHRRNVLDDIAVLTGGRVVTEATGTRIENAVPGTGILGEAKRIVISPNNTVIIGGLGEGDAAEARAEQLRKQREVCQDRDESDKLSERIARLTSGIGVITVGAVTEAERKELRDRVDDAFCASKAALRAGIVAGGGTALLTAKKALEDWAASAELVGDEQVGAKIFCDSLEAPIRKILENAGIDASMIVSKIVESGKKNYGYDALNKGFVDMIEAGIVDPTEVVINEIENASSVAALLLTTDALIVEEDPPKNSQQMM